MIFSCNRVDKVVLLRALFDADRRNPKLLLRYQVTFKYSVTAMV